MNVTEQPEIQENCLKAGAVSGRNESLAATRSQDCRSTVARVVGSETFSKTARLCALLDYICELALEGRDAELSELTIGVAVFGRSKHYNTSDDNIVRATARLLRQRLETYYSSEGKDDPIRIEVPRGAYIPLFRANLQIRAHAIKPTETQSSTIPQTKDRIVTREDGSSKKFLWRTFAFGVALGGAVAVLFVAFIVRAHTAPPKSSHLWNLLFPAGQATYVVPADTMLMLYERAAHRTVPLESYINGTFGTDSGETTPEARNLLTGLRNKRYTAITSVALAADLGQIPKAANNRMQVKFSRDVRLEDLKKSNAILIGAEQNNPWVGLFRSHLNFHLDWASEDDRFRILNDRPLGGEPKEWAWSRSDTDHRGFGQIALVRNLSGNGHVLIVAGTSMDGTQAASEFLLDPQKMAPILKQAEANDKSIRCFEILLQAKVLDHGSLGASVLGTRYYP